MKYKGLKFVVEIVMQDTNDTVDFMNDLEEALYETLGCDAVETALLEEIENIEFDFDEYDRYRNPPRILDSGDS